MGWSILDVDRRLEGEYLTRGDAPTNAPKLCPDHNELNGGIVRMIVCELARTGALTNGRLTSRQYRPFSWFQLHAI